MMEQKDNMEVDQKSGSIIRKDGRSPFQMRQFQAEQGLLNRADGSARFTQDNSSVLVAVYGPMEVRQRKEIIDRASIEVIYKPDKGVAGTSERESEHLIRSAVENAILSTLHPRTAINIIVQVLSEDGSIISAAVNGVSIALLDAGISMKSMVASVTCALTEDGTLLIDPDEKEEKSAESLFTFVFNHPYDGIVTSKTRGMFSEENYFLSLEAAKQGCSKVFAFIRGSMQKKYKIK